MTKLDDFLDACEKRHNQTAPDCGDNSCRFAVKRGGMRTNGGCRCIERSMVKWSPVEKHAAVITREVPALAQMVRAAAKALAYYVEVYPERGAVVYTNRAKETLAELDRLAGGGE